jgi:hypothetical protein
VASRTHAACRRCAAEQVASLLRHRGIRIDADRLEDRVVAERSRQKADFDAYRDEVERTASAAKNARRACELAEWSWRQKPNSNTLADARRAQQARNAAEADLREICLNDEPLIADAKRRYGR